MTEQEQSYKEFPEKNKTDETIRNLREEVESNSIPLNFGKFTRVFPVFLRNENEIQQNNDIEVTIENRNQLIKELEDKFQFRPESTEKTNPSGERLFLLENNDFFYTGYGAPTGAGSLFFSINQSEGERSLLIKIEKFNNKVRSEKRESQLIDVSPKVLGEKTQKFLKDMERYYLSKIKNQDWKSLEERFIPTYKYISKSEREKDPLGKERCIILLISQEKELFEKAQVLTNVLPKEIRERVNFDFKSVLKTYNSLLENLSKNAPQETETQKIQAFNIFAKKQEYDNDIAQIFDRLYEGNTSPEKALEKAKKDWFLSFFLNHPDTRLAEAWKKKIKNWQVKRDLKIYYDGTHRDDTKIFISILQHQIFGREEKEYIDGRVGNVFFEKFTQLSKD